MALGGELKALREKSGLTIDELSERTHIGSHILEDLEKDDYSQIRAAIYGSGFVKILAKHYGVDAAPLREEFSRQYQAWVERKNAIPLPNKAPLKFIDRRVAHQVAEREQARAEQPKAAPLPRRPAPAPAPEAPARPPLQAEPSRPAHVAAETPPPPDPAPDFNDGADSDSLGELFEQPAPVSPAPVAPANPVSEVQTPAPAPPASPVSEVQAPPVVRPAVPAEERGRTPSKFAENARRIGVDALGELKKALSSVASTVSTVAKSPLFQRVAAAALVIALGAWLSLMVVGGSRGGDDAPVQEPVQKPVGQPAPAEPAVQERESAATAESPATPEPATGRIVHEFSGSALTSNLIPPPDCYAE